MYSAVLQNDTATMFFEKFFPVSNSKFLFLLIQIYIFAVDFCRSIEMKLKGQHYYTIYFFNRMERLDNVKIQI